MATLATAEIVVPQALDPRAKQQLEDELYDVHRRIFRGVDQPAFVSYVIDSSAEHTWIQLYRDRAGALGGYLAMHVYEHELDGRTIAILRSETGTLREHRGGHITAGPFIERVLRYLVAHPRRPLYLLGSLVHPSSYSQLVRYHDEVWPREGAETPAELRELLNRLGDAFGLKCVDPSNPLVRKVGWQTIDSGRDRAYWERCDRPGVQFFLRANPGYAAGHGLLTLAPLTPGVVARAVARLALSRSRRRTRRLAARARAGLAALLPAPAPAAATAT